MKKTLTLLIICVIIATGCGPIVHYLAASLEGSIGGTDTATFPFESTVDGFIVDTGNDRSFSSLSISTDRSYMGTSSLKLPCSYTGASPFNSGIIKKDYGAGPYIDLGGCTITAYVFIPRAMYESEPDYAYGLVIFIQDINWDWFQSDWQNTELAAEGIAGKWNKIEVYTGDLLLNEVTPYAGTDVRNWGVKVGQGDESPDYTGTVYIDSITVNPAPAGI